MKPSPLKLFLAKRCPDYVWLVSTGLLRKKHACEVDQRRHQTRTRKNLYLHSLLLLTCLLRGIIAVSAQSGGTVVGWGYNAYGQTTPPAGLSNVIAIAAGYSHSLALKSDGTVVGWGDNTYGQTPPPVGLSNVIAIATGWFHSLALKSDGTVVGWGDNTYGQTPPPVGLSNVIAIAAGYEFSLGLVSPNPALGNYPDTSISLSTDTTVTPDAAPTNTTSINVSTSTNFKGKLEGNPTTGVVRVTDAHPAGTYVVMVTGFDSGGGTGSKMFSLTVTTPVMCAPVSFAAARNFAAGNEPYSIAVGDFNGDGNQDVAVANYGGGLAILLGDGAGHFSAASNFSIPNNPLSIAVGDFNGDGKQDLAVANYGNVSILLGDGTGDFSAAINFPAGTGPYSVAVGDFNGDGIQDLAVANYAGDVSILLGDGGGNFSAPTNFAAGSSSGPASIAVGDFNGDGKQDLAVPNFESNSVPILLGDGAGNFSAPTNFAAGSHPVSVAVGDFNGDGKQDLAVGNFSSADVSILIGDGAGNFSAPTNFEAGSGRSVAVGDFNGDGKQDLAVANGGNMSILLGDGTGNFSAPTYVGAGTNPFGVAVGDFNGDGRQDLGVADGGANNVSILLRNCRASWTAVSRKMQGDNAYDIGLPFTGSYGIECRSGGSSNVYQIIASFFDPITFDSVSVTSGSGTVTATSGYGTSIVTIDLSGVTNRQIINVTVFGVNDGTETQDLVIPMGVLLGDVTGNGVVSNTDVASIKAQVAAPVTASNFRNDVTANGIISNTDVAVVKGQVGTVLP